MICEPAVAFDLGDNNQTLKKNIESDVEKGWKAMLSLLFKDRGDKTVIKDRQQKGPLAFSALCIPKGKRAIPICYIHPAVWSVATLCK
jgi:urease accessory protein